MNTDREDCDICADQLNQKYNHDLIFSGFIYDEFIYNCQKCNVCVQYKIWDNQISYETLDFYSNFSINGKDGIMYVNVNGEYYVGTEILKCEDVIIKSIIE